MTNIIEKGNQHPASFGSVVDQIFHDNLSQVFDDAFWGFDGLTSRRQLPVNVCETDKTYEMEFIAPGLGRENFTVSFAGDVLTVSLMKSEEKPQEGDGKRWIHKEYGIDSEIGRASCRERV